MSTHEKHQYFYEKYLRNEMPAEERHAFEEKLSVDPDLRHSFEYYRKNRDKFLKELLVEDDKEGQKWSLNSWIYLLISLTGIVLAVNYFASKDEDQIIQQPDSSKERTWNIFNKIPLFGKTQPASPNRENIVDSPLNSIPEARDTHFVEPSIEQSEITTEEYGMATDQLLADTLFPCYESEYFESRLTIIKQEMDSVIEDSALTDLTLKSVTRNPAQAKPRMIYVEFWKSPVNFCGYRFNGKKLVVYGIYEPYHIILLYDDDTFLMKFEHKTTELNKDNNFHKF